jgi:biotin carboxyl carrier protein
MTFEIEAGGRIRQVAVTRTGAGFAVTVDGQTWNVDAKRIDAHTLSLLLGKEDVVNEAISEAISKEAVVVAGKAPGQLTVYVDDTPIAVSMNGHRRWSRGGDSGQAGGSGPFRVTAPMPGKVVRVLVGVGEKVVSRQPLLVVEAMKMENELRASREGTVLEIHAREGMLVDAGALLAVVS